MITPMKVQYLVGLFRLQHDSDAIDITLGNPFALPVPPPGPARPGSFGRPISFRGPRNVTIQASVAPPFLRIKKEPTVRTVPFNFIYI